MRATAPPLDAADAGSVPASSHVLHTPAVVRCEIGSTGSRLQRQPMIRDGLVTCRSARMPVATPILGYPEDFIRPMAAGDPKGTTMNRFEMSRGHFLITMAVLGLSVGGCPATGSDGTPDDGNANDNSQPVEEVNVPPVASAGDDQTVNTGALVVLNAGGTTDANGDRLQFLWGQIGGAPTVTLQDGFSSAPRFFAPAVVSNTTLTFRLTVGDGQAVSIDDVVITITP